MPVANQRKFVHIGNGIDRNIAQGDYSFVLWDDVEECVPLFISELQKRNIKNLSIVIANQHAAAFINSFLEPALKKSNITLTSKYEFSPGERDFRTILNKLKADKPELIYFFAFSPEIELFCKQKAEMKFTTPLTTINGFDWAESLKPFEGSWYVSYSFTDQFFNDYVAKYKRDPYASSANGYDIVNLISEVSSELVKAGKPVTRENLQKALSVKNNFVGTVGAITVDKEGFFKIPATVKEVKNGRGVTVKE
jgi:ABC-type branched-subunit amino acid transport system substrate-binding protein